MNSSKVKELQLRRRRNEGGCCCHHRCRILQSKSGLGLLLLLSVLSPTNIWSFGSVPDFSVTRRPYSSSSSSSPYRRKNAKAWRSLGRNTNGLILSAVDLEESIKNKNHSMDDNNEYEYSPPLSSSSSLVSIHVSEIEDSSIPSLPVNGDSIIHNEKIANGDTTDDDSTIQSRSTSSATNEFRFPSTIPVLSTNGEMPPPQGAFFNITKISADSLVTNLEKARTVFLQKSSDALSTTSKSTSSALAVGQQMAVNTTFRASEQVRTLYRSALDQAKAALNSTTSTMFAILGDNNKIDNDDGSNNKNYNDDDSSETLSLRRLWRRRHARTLEEGIRREKATQLSDLLNRAQIDVRRPEGRKYVERTLMGLIHALAEEVEDLDIELNTKANTPFWRKEVKDIRINFSRLGFKPIRMGGSDKYDRKGNAIVKETAREIDEGLSLVESADEAFDRIDKDKSGTLDQEEIAEALSMISELETNKESIEVLASELVNLYDVNSDGVVDREEYQQMVEDMAKLRPPPDEKSEWNEKNESPLKKVKDSVQSISKGISEKAAQVAAKASGASTPAIDPNEREMGSIVLSDLNLDLRRLVFGGVPLIKRIVPGGPLILEPFTATIRGSFTREDVMGSFLLDAGLRLLVARAIRVRLRSFRDLVDGAYFFGRKWKLKSKSAPVVQVLGLSNVEFSGEKVVLTGRARIRTSPDAPVVTNTFKVRTKFGTGNNGQIIGLREPELAFVFECPQAWENGVTVLYEKLGLPPPQRPEPLYSFFPIYSPFKVNDNAGFDMGEDNQLRKIFIKDGKLRFEMRSVLRPGRFLGSHYLAFTVPMRTFIITMDRVKEGIRVARKNKRIAAREKQMLLQDNDDNTNGGSRKWVQWLARLVLRLRLLWLGWKPKQPKPKSFFQRFVEGYTLVEREVEAKNEQLTNDISSWFGRQGNTKWNETSTTSSSETIGSETDYRSNPSFSPS